jgi:hypothetical protein
MSCLGEEGTFRFGGHTFGNRPLNGYLRCISLCIAKALSFLSFLA